MIERIDNLWERGDNYNYKDLGRVSKLAKTHFFVVQSRLRGSDVATVKWVAKARGYVFFPYPNTWFDKRDLTELAEYCTMKTEQYWAANPAKAKKRVRPYLADLVEG